MPKNGPEMARKEITAAGSHAYLVDGRITDANVISEQLHQDYGIFNAATLREPYRLEGKKTMGLEIMEQLNWESPDVIAFPTGGGVGLIGIYKAIQELNEMGWIDEMKTRMVCVQAAGCAPITEAWEKKEKKSMMWDESDTVAFGMNVPKSKGDFMVLDSLYSSGGYATSVDDDEILRTKQIITKEEGLFACPEGSSAVAGIKKLLDQGLIDRNEKVVVVNTGSGLKYPNTVQTSMPLLQPGDEIQIELEESTE
jgi:threonine synthase